MPAAASVFQACLYLQAVRERRAAMEAEGSWKLELGAGFATVGPAKVQAAGK